MFSLNSLDLGLRFIVAFLCEIYIKLVISKHIVLLLLNIKYAQEFPLQQVIPPGSCYTHLSMEFVIFINELRHVISNNVSFRQV